MNSNKALIEEELKSFLAQKFPEAAEEFELLLKPVEGADINSSHVQNLVNAIYYALLQQRADSCTLLFILVRQFAKAFKDDARVKILSDLWAGKKRDAIPVPTLEAIIIRDLSNPSFRIGQTYNYGRGARIYKLSDLLTSLQNAKTQMMNVFNDIYLENDLAYSFQMPMFDKEKSGGLPNLG